MSQQIDLTTLTNYSSLTAGQTYSISIKAKGIGVYTNGNKSAGVNYTVPVAGYSGDIRRHFDTNFTMEACTAIKFGSAPTSASDYDAYVTSSGVKGGLSSYSGQTEIYVWPYIARKSSAVIINNVRTQGGLTYANAVKVTLTGNYDIDLCYYKDGEHPID